MYSTVYDYALIKMSYDFIFFFYRYNMPKIPKIAYKKVFWKIFLFDLNVQQSVFIFNVIFI